MEVLIVLVWIGLFFFLLPYIITGLFFIGGVMAGLCYLIYKILTEPRRSH